MTNSTFVDRLIAAVSVAQELTAEGANAKKCIEALTALDSDSEVVKNTLWSLDRLSGNNKKGAQAALEFLITEGKALVAESEEQKPSRLLEIESSINELNSTAANALLGIGKLLNEARGEFEKAKEFLAWAEEKFSYKKAYVYRLMAAADKFGDKPEFEGFSIKVLTIVAGLPEEVQKQASELAKDGELSPAKVTELEKASKPEPKTEEEPEVLSAVPTEAPESTPVETTAPWESAEDSAPDFEPAPTSVVLPEAGDSAAQLEKASDKADPAELRAIIASLQERLKEVEAKASKKPELPSLPQFNNDCMAARLGLSEAQAEDVKTVRAAYRDFVKLGYGVQHPANAKLQEALNVLVKPAKKAA